MRNPLFYGILMVKKTEDYAMELNRYIDHTLLKADATKDRICQLCEEAGKDGVRTILAFRPSRVYKLLEGIWHTHSLSIH